MAYTSALLSYMFRGFLLILRINPVYGHPVMSADNGKGHRVVEIDWRSKESRVVERKVAHETYVSLFVNGERFRDFLASPGMLKEFAYGHLLCEGIIDSINDVKRVELDGVKIGVDLREGLDLRLGASKEVRLVQPECNPPDPDFLSLLDKTRKPAVEAQLKIDVETLFGMLREVNKRSLLFKSTRGVHSASLFESNGNFLSIAEDVGRHNAVDKVVGDALLRGIPLAATVLFCSGRPTVGMVLKVARAGIPVAASLSAPTEWGVKIAMDTGVTLVVAKRNFSVYSHPERVNLD